MGKIINIPDAPKQLMKILLDAGYEAYVVGGCVRDFLLGRVPHDWDICTNALPEQMNECFADYHVIETGLQHGTLTVMVDHVGYEITTYRTDGEYTDHRHPDSVQFVGTLQEDLMRRDFTINAMAADISGKSVIFMMDSLIWNINGFVVSVILINGLRKIHCVSFVLCGLNQSWGLQSRKRQRILCVGIGICSNIFQQSGLTLN